MMASTMMAAPPMPETTLPRMKTEKEPARAVMAPPMEKKTLAPRTIARGENIDASRPDRGDREDRLIRYALVNHIALSYESKSSAIRDCAIVIPLMLLATEKGWV
jgi:hypothetical protein